MEKLVQNRIACDERTAWKKLAESGTASKIWKILQNCRKRKRYLQKVEKTQKVENHVKTRKTPKTQHKLQKPSRSRKAAKIQRILDKLEKPAEFRVARKNRPEVETPTESSTATKKTRSRKFGEQENYQHKL